MTRFQRAERAADRMTARGYYRLALDRYNAALATVERAKAELDRREADYRTMEVRA